MTTGHGSPSSSRRSRPMSSRSASGIRALSAEEQAIPNSAKSRTARNPERREIPNGAKSRRAERANRPRGNYSSSSDRARYGVLRIWITSTPHTAFKFEYRPGVSLGPAYHSTASAWSAYVAPRSKYGVGLPWFIENVVDVDLRITIDPHAARVAEFWHIIAMALEARRRGIRLA